MDANTLYFEPMVTAFLSADPRVFVSPQYRLVLKPSSIDENGRHVEEKLQWPDAVAVRPDKDVAFLIEITTRATNFKPLADKVIGYIHEKEKYLDILHAECGHRFNELLPWLFMRKEFYSEFRRYFEPIVGINYPLLATALEDVANPWKYIVKDRRSNDYLM